MSMSCPPVIKFNGTYKNMAIVFSSSPPTSFLFLDIDGVLLPFGNQDTTTTITTTDVFPKSTLHAFNHILSECPGVEIVLSSTWRCGGQSTILQQFNASDLHPLREISEFVHMTNLEKHDHRQWEIAEWLEKHQRENDIAIVSSWVALDDEELVVGEANKLHSNIFDGHCVKTESSMGLRWCDAQHAVRILRASQADIDEERTKREIALALPLVLTPRRPPPNVCRHWWRKRTCRMAELCRFLHPPIETLPILPKKKYRNRTMNAGRFRQFREWVVQTFDVDELKSEEEGSGVLCVADGKGVLSFELWNVHGIPTTAVDPRPLKIDKCLTLWERGMYHKKSNEKIKRFVPERSQKETPHHPRHLRAFFLPELWESKTRESFERNLLRARRTAWTGQGLEEREKVGEKVVEKVAEKEEKVEKSRVVTEQLATLEVPKEGETLSKGETKKSACSSSTSTSTSTSEIVDHVVAMEILQKAKLVLGMHPDQAAGPIVEYAVSHGIDFAVVPCCVYSDEFPKRKMKSGKRVTSYDDLCQYLEELAPPGEIQRCVIPMMEGKNVCLYRVTKRKEGEQRGDR